MFNIFNIRSFFNKINKFSRFNNGKPRGGHKFVSTVEQLGDKIPPGSFLVGDAVVFGTIIYSDPSAPPEPAPGPYPGEGGPVGNPTPAPGGPWGPGVES